MTAGKLANLVVLDDDQTADINNTIGMVRLAASAAFR